MAYSKYSGGVCDTAVFLFNLTTNGFQRCYYSINVKISYTGGKKIQIEAQTSRL